MLAESMNMNMKYKEYKKMMYEFQIHLQKLSIYISISSSITRRWIE